MIMKRTYTYEVCLADAPSYHLELDKEMSLIQMQTIVGGYIEVHNRDGKYVICNDEGRLRGLKPNPKLPGILGNAIITDYVS